MPLKTSAFKGARKSKPIYKGHHNVQTTFFWFHDIIYLDDENNTSRADNTYYRKPDDVSKKSEAPKDYISGDVKFIITVVIGLAIILAIVVFIPSVSEKTITFYVVVHKVLLMLQNTIQLASQLHLIFIFLIVQNYFDLIIVSCIKIKISFIYLENWTVREVDATTAVGGTGKTKTRTKISSDIPSYLF